MFTTHFTIFFVQKKKRILFFLLLFFPVNKTGGWLVGLLLMAILTFPTQFTQTSPASHATHRAEHPFGLPVLLSNKRGEGKRSTVTEPRGQRLLVLRAPTPPRARGAPPLPGRGGRGGGITESSSTLHGGCYSSVCHVQMSKPGEEA